MVLGVKSKAVSSLLLELQCRSGWGGERLHFLEGHHVIGRVVTL